MGQPEVLTTEHDIFEQEDMRLFDAELDVIARAYNQPALTAEENKSSEEEAKQLHTAFDTIIAENFVEQTWQLAENFEEENERARQATTRLLGNIAIRGEAAERAETAGEEQTLMTAIKKAVAGDVSAQNVIRNNVATDVAERMFKAAHQTRIKMQIKDGKLQQEGRLLTNIHRNTLEHTILNPEMLRRSTYELHNAHLFEQLHASGALCHYDALVFSPASTTMSLADKQRYNFFIDTETCSIQWLSAEGNDVTFDSAFVAGKRTPDSERHDIAAIQKVAAQRGIELAESDGTELIQHVFLVPKGELRGVEGAVAWFDQAVGEHTFYGLDMPTQDYNEYVKVCKERADNFSGIVEKIVQQLMSEADAFATPVEAIMRLDELSERYCVKEAITDVSLDENVFGKTAAGHIMDARQRIAMGDFEGANQALLKAQETAVSGSCPLAKERTTGEDGATDSNASSEDDSQEKWMNCPYCSAKVFADPCAVKLSCWDCTAMVFNGKVISTGNGGSKRRRQKALAAA